MRHYFAYGSNMSLQRLQARTLDVVHHGRALLDGYAHRFSHRGQDGSAKGNIERASDGRVQGVLYQLTVEQTERLHPYEGGYQMIDVQIVVAGSNEVVSAYTYLSQRITEGLQPLPGYLEHYVRGMRENRFPQSYIDAILRQAKQ